MLVADEVDASVELVAPTGVDVVLVPATVDVVARLVVAVDAVVDVVVRSTGLAVVAVVGVIDTDTGICVTGAVRTWR
ncbi:MAG TPA: hypothetical protein VMT43_13495 [Acidimicrobiales bacterium]|nr:hypothetical protein [Acidimicrobiales bacterium]